MAISTNTFTINASYTKGDMITQLESAYTWLDWHDECNHTGIITGLVDRGMYQQDPHNTSWSYISWNDAEQNSTSGVGTELVADSVTDATRHHPEVIPAG